LLVEDALLPNNKVIVVAWLLAPFVKIVTTKESLILFMTMKLFTTLIELP